MQQSNVQLQNATILLLPRMRDMGQEIIVQSFPMGKEEKILRGRLIPPATIIRSVSFTV